MPFPAFDSSKYTFPDGRRTFPAQWDSAVRLMEGAEKAGVIDAPVRVIDQPKNGLTATQVMPGRSVTELNRFRIRTVAEQLWLLGYLEKKPRKNLSAKHQSSNRFRGAIRRFQSEAGLVVDGWVGDETWRALNALVGFESWTHVERWATGEQGYRRAFRRAIQLRLFSYGLADKRPGKGFTSVPAANAVRARRCLANLGVWEGDPEESNPSNWVERLFDHNALIAAAGAFGASFDQTGNLKGAPRREFRSLLVNLAKIELWLLGSDIQIDGKDDYPVTGLGVAKKQRRRANRTVRVDATDPDVRRYLTEYWGDLLELPQDEAREQAAELSPALFRSLEQPSKFSPKVGEAVEDPDYSVEIANQFESRSNTTGAVKAAYKESRRAGMKLFDGLRRLWKWVKQGIKKVIEFGKNVLRGFYRFAIKSYVVVRTAISAFVRSLEQYSNGKVDTPSGIDVTLSRDLDTCVLIDAAASPGMSRESAFLVRRFATMFQLSARIISLIVDVLKSAYKGLVGWVRLLMVLVKHYRALVPAYRELVAII